MNVLNLGRVDRINVEAVIQYGPDRHIVSVPVDPSCMVSHGSRVLFEALECAVKTASVRVELEKAKIPQPEREFAERERGGFGGYIRQHPLCDPGRELSDTEMRDLGRCIYTYAGRGLHWMQQNLRNYTACDPNHYLANEPMSKLMRGRALAILKRVVCVNPDDWERPPLYIPTGWGIHAYIDAIQQTKGCFAPAEWMLKAQEELGMGRDAELQAVNKARMRLKMAPWER